MCNLVDVGTGVPSGTDMSQDIDDTISRIDEILANPGDLKVITPNIPVQIVIEDDGDPIWDTLLTQVSETAVWANLLDRDEKTKVEELSQRFLTCLNILKNRFAETHSNADSNGEID